MAGRTQEENKMYLKWAGFIDAVPDPSFSIFDCRPSFHSPSKYTTWSCPNDSSTKLVNPSSGGARRRDAAFCKLPPHSNLLPCSSSPHSVSSSCSTFLLFGSLGFSLSFSPIFRSKLVTPPEDFYCRSPTVCLIIAVSSPSSTTNSSSPAPLIDLRLLSPHLPDFIPILTNNCWMLCCSFFISLYLLRCVFFPNRAAFFELCTNFVWEFETSLPMRLLLLSTFVLKSNIPSHSRGENLLREDLTLGAHFKSCSSLILEEGNPSSSEDVVHERPFWVTTSVGVILEYGDD